MLSDRNIDALITKLTHFYLKLVFNKIKYFTEKLDF